MHDAEAFFTCELALVGTSCVMHVLAKVPAMIISLAWAL